MITINWMIGVNRINGTNGVDPRVERTEVANAWFWGYECDLMDSIEHVLFLWTHLSGKGAKRSAHPFRSPSFVSSFPLRAVSPCFPRKRRNSPFDSHQSKSIEPSTPIRRDRIFPFGVVGFRKEIHTGGLISSARPVRLPLE